MVTGIIQPSTLEDHACPKNSSSRSSSKTQTSAVFVGIDWGGDHHQICIVDDNSCRLLQARVTHDVTGLRDLLAHLSRHGYGLPIAIERSEGLLVEHLQQAGHRLFAVSPRVSARARERYRVAPVKDDRFDAYVLADSLRHELRQPVCSWRELSVPSPLLAEIRALTRDRDRLLGTQQATEAQLRSILEAHHPAPVRLFSSVDRAITLSFIHDYPTPATASRVKTTGMAGFLQRHHYTGRVPAQTLAGRLRREPTHRFAGDGRGEELLRHYVRTAPATTQHPGSRVRRRDRSRGLGAPGRGHLR